MDKLVYGLGGGLVYSCGGNGKWKKTLPKILKSFDNAVLISTVDMSYVAAKVIYDTVGKDRLFLDSGGFTLYKRQLILPPDEFAKECEKMKSRFVKMLSIGKYTQVFELDNDYFKHNDDLLSPENFCRQEVKDITGEWPTPIFKMHQGFEYWKGLCDSDIYPNLAIGGLAQTRDWKSYRDEITKMMNYARQKGKKVHLLGAQNVETFKLVKPDTIDYSIFQYAQNLKHARDEHPDLDSYADLKIHAALYAFARAKARNFLYNSSNDEDENIE